MSKANDVGATPTHNCLLCKHYRAGNTPDMQLQGIGICTCNPPQVTTQPVKTPQGIGVQVGAAFPMVNKDIVCGQFAMKQIQLAAEEAGDGS